MRVMPIRVRTGYKGWKHGKAAFKKNWRHYIREASGLALFMISACLFGALLEANDSELHKVITNSFTRIAIMGILMGGTALFIFYSPFTAPSGSQINPAVTLTFFRIGKMCPWDTLFYILFQCAGGLIAVYSMQLLMGDILIKLPVNSVATVPGKFGTAAAFIAEFIIAFVTMTMVLITSIYENLKNYTRLFSGILVCSWVILAGPVSGFGMNPARSFASALPSGTWTAFWIYLITPVSGMLLAAEFFIFFQKKYKKSNIGKEPAV